MRSGLSYKDMNEMPVTEFYELYIFDTFIEPQGPQVDDVRNAQNLQTMWLTSSNMTKESSRKIKIKEFMAVKPDEDVFKSEAMLKAMRDDEQRQKQKKMLDSISDPKVKEKMLKAMRSNDGKE